MKYCLVYLLLGLFFCNQLQIAVGKCGFKGKSDEHSQKLLKRLEPLYNLSFQDTYEDGNTDRYNYYLTICGGISIDGYHNNDVGVIQEDLTYKNNMGKRYVEVGRITSTIIKGGTDWIMLTYADGKEYNTHCRNVSSGKRQAHIMILCDPNVLKGELKVLYEHNDEGDALDCFYMMELTSSVACNYQSSGLSSGSIFLILLFSFFGTYLLMGALYKRCVYGSKGMDQIPNIGFWKTCGSLQADGCNVMCRCTGSGYNSNKPYEGVADDQLDEEIDDEHLLPM